MHDGLGSSLLGALRMVERGRLDEAELTQILQGCIDDLKLTIDSMEPVETDLLLLLGTLRFRLQPRLESTGIKLHWDVHDVPPLVWLDQRHALHILRVLQEAFTNIIKHADATEATVSTSVVGGDNAKALRSVFDSVHAATGLDLAGIIQGQAVGRGFGAGVAQAEPHQPAVRKAAPAHADEATE